MRSDGQELKLVRIMEREETVGIAPLLKKGGLITFLGGTDLWDVHDFVVIKGEEQRFFHGLMNYFQKEDWEEIKLESLLEMSPTLTYISSLGKDLGYRVEQHEEDSLMGVTLPDTWDEYLTGLRKKDRHELRRKLRRLESQAVFRIQQLTDPYSISDAMDDFLRLMAQSREEKSQFLTAQRETFFRQMFLELAQRKLLQLFFLEIDGVKTAATVCFDYNNVLSLYNSGHNTDYAILGTGFILKALCLKKAICERKDYFDLLRGTEPYKQHLGAKSQELYSLSIYH